jgi:hypothetical protein
LLVEHFNRAKSNVAANFADERPTPPAAEQGELLRTELERASF